MAGKIFRDDDYDHDPNGVQLIPLVVAALGSAGPSVIRRIRLENMARVRIVQADNHELLDHGCRRCNHPFYYLDTTDSLWKCEACGRDDLRWDGRHRVTIAKFLVI